MCAVYNIYIDMLLQIFGGVVTRLAPIFLLPPFHIQYNMHNNKEHNMESKEQNMEEYDTSSSRYVYMCLLYVHDLYSSTSYTSHLCTPVMHYMNTPCWTTLKHMFVYDIYILYSDNYRQEGELVFSAPYERRIFINIEPVHLPSPLFTNALYCTCHNQPVATHTHSQEFYCKRQQTECAHIIPSICSNIKWLVFRDFNRDSSILKELTMLNGVENDLFNAQDVEPAQRIMFKHAVFHVIERTRAPTISQDIQYIHSHVCILKTYHM